MPMVEAAVKVHHLDNVATWITAPALSIAIKDNENGILEIGSHFLQSDNYEVWKIEKKSPLRTSVLAKTFSG
jgi:hypothetical protein